MVQKNKLQAGSRCSHLIIKQLLCRWPICSLVLRQDHTNHTGPANTSPLCISHCPGMQARTEYSQSNETRSNLVSLPLSLISTYPWLYAGHYAIEFGKGWILLSSKAMCTNTWQVETGSCGSDLIASFTVHNYRQVWQVTRPKRKSRSHA